MDVTRAIPSHVGPTSFAFLTSDEIKRISVRQISNPELLDNTNNPNAGGLYDPALGPMRRDDICGTCHQNSFRCPGHFGHIQLPSPVFHPLFMPQMYTLLRGVCLYCHRFKVKEVFAIRVVAQLRLLDYGLVQAAEDVGRDMLQYDKKQSADESLGTQGNMMDLEAKEGTDDEDGDGVSAFVFDKNTKKESVMQFQERITNKVQRLIRDAVRQGARRNADSTGAAYTARKAVVSQFTKQIIITDTCPHCLVVNPRLRKDGFVKIVERMLSEHNELRNEARGFHRLNLTQLMSKKAKRETSKQNSPQDNDDDDDEATAAHVVVSGAVKEKLKEAMKASKKQSTETRVMPPFECRANLRMTFERESVLCNLIFGRHGLASADVFFMDVVSVSPTRFRPAAMMGDQTIENAQNELLSKVLRTCIDIRGLNETLLLLNSKASGERSTQERVKAGDALMGAMIQLQQDVNCFIDSSKAPASGAVQPTPGVKQALEKKEGLFRKHMMGKRVNFAARSVISPDVNIETNEIGVPPVFAQKLTFNEPVTVHNIERMRRLVINGPDAYPGAVAVRNENGYETLLGPLSVEQRTALANQLLTPQEHTSRQTKGTFAGLGKSTATPPANKQVLRHLIDGDILILNRQPTLHKASMMAHRARVLKGERTIRMHYANCNSYNADFDGDEMNMHFPQSQAARAESCLIANNDNQYLVPTSGNPLRGLIQDHVVAGVWMTSKATLYTREEYQQMLYGALRPEDDYSGNGRVHTVPPAIWKPKPLWTGKQVITTVLLNLRPIGSEGLNMTSKSKVNGKLWGKGHEQEGTVIFRNGELLTGILDKAQFGASAYGMVHAVYEAYGADTAGKLLSVLSRLFTKWLQVNAFTCRMDDLLLSAKGDEARREMLKTAGKLGRAAALQTVGLPKDSKDEYNLHVRLEEVLRDDGKAAALDSGMLGAARNLRTEIIAEVLPGGQHRVFPENNFEMMVSSGAKGSLVNFSQISALLGAQELEGRRVPVMVSGKTLPSFKPFDTSLRAGGFVSGRFLTGIRPQEYYFHCMSGREGLIDTAVKTSRSGYLQRCLIKHLEGITVHYDNTVRNSDGTVVQFLYGEDGLDVTKSKYLDQLDFTAENFATFKRRYDPSQLMGVTNEDEAAQYAKKALKKPHKFAPVTSVYNPATYLGSTSETFAAQLQSYIDRDPLKILAARKKDKKKQRNDGVPPPKIEDVREKIERESFRVMNHVLYHRGLVDPGEGVGLVAAQSVGEPSTQMTLNTFHLAGHGAANVTLGIPRLREIVMTASQNIKTPIMKLPVLDGVTQEQKTLFCKDGSRLLLSQVVQNAVVEEKISAKSISTDFHRVKSYSVWLHLFPIAECQEEYNVGVSEILRGIEMTFARILEREILKELRRLTRDRLQQMHSIGHGERYTQDGKPAAAEAEEGGGEADDASGGGKRGGKGDNAKAAVQAKTSAARAADDSDDEEGGGDDADEGGDGDADDAKRKRRSGAQVSYEEDEDDSSDDGGGGDAQPDTEESIDAAFAATKSRKRTAEEDEEARTAIAEQVLELEAKLQETCKYITAFEFDQKKHKWVRMELQLPRTDDKLLLISVVERACRMSVVHEVPHVGRMLCPAEPDADGMPDPNADYRLTAEGINLPGIWDFADGIVDMDNIYTNDIGAMLHTYGVEAARGAIVAEMRAIFDTYGINVSARHLQLISDYQTSMGGFLPFSRGGLAHAPSPLLKASYEMTMAFIAQAALYGEQDDMQGPSANIVVGRPIKGGTGLPQIITSIA